MNEIVSGKRIGTEILMYDGTTKRVEDVKIGDLVMGDDNLHREVVSTFNGKDNLYKIEPTDSTKPYYVTGNDILSFRYNSKPALSQPTEKNPRYSVKYTKTFMDNSTQDNLSKVLMTSVNFAIKRHTEEIAKVEAENIFKVLIEEYYNTIYLHEVSVVNYIAQAKNLNRLLSSYRIGVEYAVYEEQTFNPYLLGMWLGDGTSRESSITNIDQELIDFMYSEAIRINMKLNVRKVTKTQTKAMTYSFVSPGKPRAGSNIFKNFLRDFKLLNNKHIPHIYKVNSRENRLALLAGLIDTDGYMTDTYFEITQKNKTLSNDIVFLARSLGFWCHIRPCEKGCTYNGVKRNGNYHRISFGGYGLHEIPTLLPRKQMAERIVKFQKEPLYYRTILTKEEVESEYYGFKFEGQNQRFLLSDFTVSHS